MSAFRFVVAQCFSLRIDSIRFEPGGRKEPGGSIESQRPQSSDTESTERIIHVQQGCQSDERDEQKIEQTQTNHGLRG